MFDMSASRPHPYRRAGVHEREEPNGAMGFFAITAILMAAFLVF